MNNDDDPTVIQTEEDREKLEKEILSGRYDSDPEDDNTTTVVLWLLAISESANSLLQSPLPNIRQLNFEVDDFLLNKPNSIRLFW